MDQTKAAELIREMQQTITSDQTEIQNLKKRARNIKGEMHSIAVAQVRREGVSEVS